MKRSLDPMEPMETSDLGVKDTSKDTISSTHRNKRRKNRRRNKETPKPNNTEDPYGTIEYDNELFFKYYQEQLSTIITTEEEWAEFKAALLRTLPVTFRVCLSSKEVMTSINQQLKTLSNELLKEESDIKLCLDPITWYPDQNAWSVNIDARKLKRKESETLKTLHNFIVEHNTKGNISRQEIVSMIPPLLLDVSSSQLILDMCAAPGSKTTQILEMMHQDAQIQTGNRFSHPDGVLIANDVKPERCNTLITQTKRLRSPSIIVTNHEAQIFPTLYHSQLKKPIHFDRILCDVPCTGDGTLRKNPDLWPRWKPAMGPGLHTLQYQILKRAIKLLSPGGRIVYSTCSHNPVENEAIISTMLNKYPELKLVDVSNELPDLRRAPGLLTWKFMDNEGNWYDTYDQLPEKLRSKLPPSLFPNGREKELHLERCIRLLPHYQDSGAFFVAVLEKNQDDAVEPIDKARASEFRKNERIVPVPGGSYYYPGTEEFKKQWDHLRKYLEMDTFPDKQIITLSENASKLNFVSTSSKFIFDYDIDNKLRIKNMGTRIFERVSNPNDGVHFRMCQDGVEVLSNYCPTRIIDTPKKDMVILLTQVDPFLEMFEPETKEKLLAIAFGPCIFRYSEGSTSSFLVSGWRGRVSATVFLKEAEKTYYLNQMNA